jgi:BRCT domain type II-containing protein
VDTPAKCPQKNSTDDGAVQLPRPIQGLKHTMRNLKIQNYKSVETIQSLKHTVRNSKSHICKRFSVNIASALKNIKIGQYVKWDK